MLSPYGKELRKLRIDRGWLLSDLAERLGVSVSYLSAVETGRKSIPPDFNSRLATALELTSNQVVMLNLAKENSRREFSFKLPRGASSEDRQAAAVLARSFETGDAAMLEKLRALLKEGK